jgi:hypothetical protein
MVPTSGRLAMNRAGSEIWSVCDANELSTKWTGGKSSAMRALRLWSASAARTDACEYRCVTWRVRCEFDDQTHAPNSRYLMGERGALLVALSQTDQEVLDLLVLGSLPITPVVAVLCALRCLRSGICLGSRTRRALRRERVLCLLELSRK